jgi:hypothetical protein
VNSDGDTTSRLPSSHIESQPRRLSCTPGPVPTVRQWGYLTAYAELMITDITVVVPAADEEQRISGCLDAIGVARGHLDEMIPEIRTSVVVVLDDCHDATAQIVSRFLGVQALISTARNVGAARRLGSEHALEQVATPRSAWLANTDADSQVPQDWLIGMVRQANDGADVILGTVLPGDGLHPGVEQAWFAAHDLSDGHPHVHGANFGIRASTYVRLGGWRPLVTGEDTDLADRAAHVAGVHMLRSAKAPVVTSTRGYARAPHGFSSYLHKLREADPPISPAIPTPSSARLQLRAKASSRD